MDVIVYDKVGKESKAVQDILLATFPQKTVTNQAIASFSDGAEDIPVKALTVAIELVQSGSGDPAPDNVRPITGHTGVTVTRMGKNLIPTFTEGGSSNGITWTVSDNGTVTVNGTATATVVIVSDYSTWMWDGVTPCWLSGCPAGGNWESGYSLRVSTSNSSTYSSYDTGNGRALVGYSDNSKIDNVALCYAIIIRSGTVCNNLVFTPQLEYGTSATDYEAYSGTTVSVDWTSEAGTVYGGTLNVITGVLTVDRVGVTLDGTESFTYNTASTGVPYITTTVGSNGVSGSVISNMYPDVTIAPSAGSVGIRVQNNALLIYNEQFTDLDAAIALLEANPVQATYQLKTTITYQLTAQQMTTLLGENNIWANTGNIKSLTYRADLGLYLTNEISTTIADAVASI